MVAVVDMSSNGAGDVDLQNIEYVHEPWRQDPERRSPTDKRCNRSEVHILARKA